MEIYPSEYQQLELNRYEKYLCGMRVMMKTINVINLKAEDIYS